jgi:hypothetical protein
MPPLSFCHLCQQHKDTGVLTVPELELAYTKLESATSLSPKKETLCSSVLGAPPPGPNPVLWGADIPLTLSPAVQLAVGEVMPCSDKLLCQKPVQNAHPVVCWTGEGAKTFIPCHELWILSFSHLVLVGCRLPSMSQITLCNSWMLFVHLAWINSAHCDVTTAWACFTTDPLLKSIRPKQECYWR